MVRKFSAFSGYDSQSLPAKKYGFNMETVGTSEIDESAILASAVIHYDMSIDINYPPIDKILERFIARNTSFNFKTGVNPWVKILERGKYSEKMTKRIYTLFKSCILTKNFGDISLIDPNQIPNHDLFTYSFPCQDISMAGLQKGLEEGSGSRSSLLWECQKIIELKKPKYLMMENVKNLVSKKHKPDFDKWLNYLESLGYNNYWKVINAKNCGVPQNRERVFCVSILKEHDNFGFHFYDDFDSGIRLKDILEDHVDEKYYLSDEKTRSLIESLEANGYNGYNGYKRNYECEGNSYCIDASYAKGTSPGDVGKSRRTHIVEACAIRGRNPINPKSRKSGLPTQQMLEVSKNPDINNCSTTVQKDTMLLEKPSFRIRKLTPRECFRLMGVSDSDIDKIQATGISNSQQYKMAGNSIVVDCMKFLEQLTQHPLTNVK